jgi:membrane protein required for colicin V production
MNHLDIIVLTIIGALFAFGLWKGLIKQLFSLAGILVGYVAALEFYEQSALYFSGLDENVAKITGFILIFVICIILSSIIAAVVGKIVKFAELSWLNRVAGGLLGFVKGFLITGIIVLVLVAFLPSESRLLRNSVMLPYMMTAAEMAEEFIPENIMNDFMKKLEELKTYWIQKELGNEPNEVHGSTENAESAESTE